MTLSRPSTMLEDSIAIDRHNGSDRAQDIQSAVAQVMSAVDSDLKSELNDRQIALVAIARAYAELYKCSLLGETVNMLLRLRYSRHRKSRGEMVESIKSVLLTTDVATNAATKKLLGM